jgi:cytochrome bd-type quinol oxidase subunit 2
MDTSILSNINWLAVLVAGAAYFTLGALWYSVLFGKAWIRLSGVNVNDPNAKKGAGGIMLTSFILMIIASIGLALFISKINSYTWMTGAKVGLIAGVCFSVTGISISYLYEKRPFGLHLINGAYNTIGCIIAGIIISVWP